MDPTEPNEPSYYEIALTSRQVLVAFVLLLTCMLVAFFSGVWIGRGGSEGRAVVQAAASPAAGQPPLEDLRFFSEDRRAGAPPATPVTPPATVEPKPGRTLAEDVGATPSPAMLPTRLPSAAVTPAAPTPNPNPTTIAPPTAAPPAATAAPRAATGAATGAAAGAGAGAAGAVATGTAPSASGIFVQVISSREESKAKRIQQDLSKRGFKAFISPITREGQKVYRVRIGPFERRDQAQVVLAQVRKTVSRDAIVTDKP